MNFLFRCDASSALGSGHALRCLTLADELKRRGHGISFAVNATAPSVAPALRAHALHILDGPVLPPEDEAASLDIDVAAVVVDHYGLDARFHRAAARRGARIVVIDDLADRRHAADIVIDATPGRHPADYAEAAAGADLLLGGDYALLRPGFRAERLRRRTRPAPSGRLNLLISLGGTDPDNITSHVLDALVPLTGLLEVTIVLGAGAPHADAIAAQVMQLPYPATLRRNVTDMPALLAQADMAVGAPGGSSLERSCVGLPSLLLRTADNQRFIEQALHESGAAVALGPWQANRANLLVDALRRIIRVPGRLSEMGERSRALVDGLGAARVALAVTGWERSAALGIVSLRRATAADVLDARGSEHESLSHVVLHRGQPAGLLHLEALVPHSDASFRLTMPMVPGFRGQGIEGAALRLARSLLPDAHFLVDTGINPELAEILPRAGYRATAAHLFEQRPGVPVAE